MSEILSEEFEVLESIYPTELNRLSHNSLTIAAEPDELPEGFAAFAITLKVHYPEGYPDTLPDLSFEDLDDEISSQEEETLLAELRSTAEENLGMAMTFTLVSLLREKLSDVVKSRLERQRQAELEKERKELEEEEARTRGTRVTVESFMAWKAAFDLEQRKAKQAADEGFLKGLSPKEREEWKKIGGRMSGRQLFLKHQDLEEDLEDEEATSVDISQYDRTKQQEEAEEEDNGVTFSDSD